MHLFPLDSHRAWTHIRSGLEDSTWEGSDWNVIFTKELFRKWTCPKTKIPIYNIVLSIKPPWKNVILICLTSTGASGHATHGEYIHRLFIDYRLWHYIYKCAYKGTYIIYKYSWSVANLSNCASWSATEMTKKEAKIWDIQLITYINGKFRPI